MGLTANAATQNWPQTFRRLIVTNSRYWLKCAQGDLDTLMPEAPQVLKSLSYALRLPEAWPPARDLILQLNAPLTRRGLGPEWQGVLTRAIARSREERDPAEIELRLHLATLYRLQARLSEARDCLQEALALCERDSSSPHYWVVITHMALVARLSADQEEALDHCRRVLAEKDLPPSVRAEALNVRGLVAYDRREWEEALDCFGQALALYRSLDDPHQEARLLTNRGVVLQRTDRWDEAEESYQEAILRFQVADDHIEIFKAVMNLGNIFLMRKDYEAAIQQYQKALPVFEQYNYMADQANAYNNLGLAYTGRSDCKAAEAYFGSAAEIWRNLGDTYNFANVLDNLGDMFIQANRPRQAKVVLKQALQALNTVSESPTNVQLRQEIEGHLIQLKS